jgi:hypothetical protein
MFRIIAHKVQRLILRPGMSWLIREALVYGPKVTLTREELYEKVWSTPMQKLAAEFGFSDRGLAKLCRCYKVPVPSRGYWARLQSHQTLTAVCPRC